MENKFWYGLLILVLIGCMGCSQKVEPVTQIVAKVDSGAMMIGGSGSNIALTRRLAAEYARQSGLKIEIPGSIGTSGAVKATQAGAVLLGLTSRALTSAEKAQGLKQIHYASVGLAVAVNSSVPDTEIDRQSLVQIYMEEKTTWNNGANIIPLSMFEGDSTNLVLQTEVPGFAAALQNILGRKNWQIIYSEGLMLEDLAKTPNSIGFIDSVALADSQGKIRAMKLNGVEMNAESLQTNRYPLKKELYFIYKDPIATSAKAFIDFCFSDSGRQIILSSGAALPQASEDKQ